MKGMLVVSCSLHDKANVIHALIHPYCIICQTIYDKSPLKIVMRLRIKMLVSKKISYLSKNNTFQFFISFSIYIRKLLKIGCIK